jgi:hypothetical protein
VDTSAYPSVRVTVVTPQPADKAPRLSEDGKPVVGFTAKNFGREKSVVLLFDRSQSMLGKAMQDATAAARSFVRSKPASDRIAVVAVGKQAFQLTGFSSGLRGRRAARLEVDKVRGTALYDAVVLSSELSGRRAPGACPVLLTDGQEVSSKASLEDAIAAANDAHVTVYPIGIESPSFKPAPLKRLAAETGGRYSGAAGTASLHAIYAALAQELRRTWQLTYFTTARPGDSFELAAGAAHATALAPGTATKAAAESSVPKPVFAVGPMLVATLVGLCALIGAIFLLKAPVGAGLRRRLAPHIGEPERKRSRGPVEERFATASSLMRATERAFGNLSLWHKLHKLLERADLPLRTVELAYICLGSGLLLALIFGIAGAGTIFPFLALLGGAMIPVGFVWYKARQRLRAIDDQLPDLHHARGVPQGGAQLPGRNPGRRRRGAAPASKEFNRGVDGDTARPTEDDALADMADRVA